MLLVYELYQLEQLVYALTGLCGDEHERRVGHEREVYLQLLAEIVHSAVGLVLDCVPLVYGDYARLALVVGVACDLAVLLGEAYRRVDDDNAHVGAVDCHEGAQNAEMLDILDDLSLAAHSGGVDEDELILAALYLGVYRVAGGSGNVGDDGAFLAGYLVDERGLKPATVDGVHNILHQIFDMAVDDNYIRNNPTNNVLRELKKAHCFKTEKRRGLTRPEQELFMDYLKNSNTAVYWYPVFAVMLGTGLRVGEVTGLRWCDIDLEDGIIDVNHTLVYYDHRTSEGKKGCYFNVNTPKTEAGNRQVPMLDFVKEAFVMEKERQELLGVHCEATIDGYTDFIFLNRFGQPQHQSTLNKAIRRIIRDCNDEQFLKTENPEVLLPHFSCHSLRHTFTTRMCEAGVNIKVIQDTLGHKDITTTLNIYTDVTKELKRTEFDGLDKYFNNSIA